MKSTVLQGPLALHFIDLEGQLTKTKTITLNWETDETNTGSSFAIERAADSRSFMAIGTVDNKNSFDDNFPLPGYNYYRVRSIEPSGEDVYSKVIRILNSSSALVDTYPNPVRDELNIRLAFPVMEDLLVRVTDATGQIRFLKQIPAVQDYKINTSSWPSQLYFITVHTNSGEFLGKQSFLR